MTQISTKTRPWGRPHEMRHHCTGFMPHSLRIQELRNAAVCLRIFIYKAPKMKLGSVCRADRAQSNVPILSSLADFHIELEREESFRHAREIINLKAQNKTKLPGGGGRAQANQPAFSS